VYIYTRPLAGLVQRRLTKSSLLLASTSSSLQLTSLSLILYCAHEFLHIHQKNTQVKERNVSRDLSYPTDRKSFRSQPVWTYLSSELWQQMCQTTLIQHLLTSHGQEESIEKHPSEDKRTGKPWGSCNKNTGYWWLLCYKKSSLVQLNENAKPGSWPHEKW